MEPESEVKFLGRYVVADPKICHGKLTFRGTRIMVWQVLEMLADGLTWETIMAEWRGSISKEAIVETVKLAGEAFLRHWAEFAVEPTARRQ